MLAPLTIGTAHTVLLILLRPSASLIAIIAASIAAFVMVCVMHWSDAITLRFSSAMFNLILPYVSQLFSIFVSSGLPCVRFLLILTPCNVICIERG